MERALAREDVLLPMIELAYAADDDVEMMHGVFELLRKVFPFRSGVFMPVNPATMELQSGLCFDCGMAEMAIYLEHYAPLDPFVLRQPGPAVVNQNRLLSEVVTAGELGRSEFSDFLRQVPYRHAMGMLTGVAQQAVAAVSVHRQAHERDFSREEKAVLDCIGPHLARAVVLRRLASDAEQRAQTGIAVFAGSGESLYLNAPARAFLQGSPPSVVLAALPAQGSGAIRLGAQTFRVSRLPWSAASLLRPFAGEDAAEAIDGTPSVRLPMASWPERTPRTPGATIVVLRPFHPRTDVLRRLVQYGLSPRQSEIAAWALRGLTNTEIAQQICIGEQTVRDHFQEIYCRIGVRTRTELLATVLGTTGSAAPHRRGRGEAGRLLTTNPAEGS
ncbi:MAG: helix-turn-helix transcriptional regulator [Candidatus Accumulibacter sp. UW25]|jgi:DNA-binding CsgD family transcriptional regulator